MRTIIILALLAALAGCSSDKYSETAKATGPWIQANSDPDNQDNAPVGDWLVEARR